MRDDVGQPEEERIIPDYEEKGKENVANLMQKNFKKTTEKLVTFAKKFCYTKVLHFHVQAYLCNRYLQAL